MGMVDGLDARVEELMSAVRLDSQPDLDAWRDAVAAACPAEREDLTVDEFARSVRAGSAWPSGSADRFLQTLESFGDGVRPVVELLRTMEQRPDAYWTLYHLLHTPSRTEVAAGTADRFGWLSQDQARRLAAGWGERWRDYLGEQLDYRWGENWEAVYAVEGSQGYLDPLVDEWLSPQPEPVESPPVPPSAQETDALIDEALQEAVRTTPGADMLTAEELAELADEIRAENAGSLR